MKKFKDIFQNPYEIKDYIDIQGILRKIIEIKSINDTSKNHAFLSLNEEEMKLCEYKLRKTPFTMISALYSDENVEADETLNLVFDCKGANFYDNDISNADCMEDNAVVLLDLEFLQKGLKDAYSHITINLINFQEIKDETIIYKLSETVNNCDGNICFNIFSMGDEISDIFLVNKVIVKSSDELKLARIM